MYIALTLVAFGSTLAILLQFIKERKEKKNLEKELKGVQRKFDAVCRQIEEDCLYDLRRGVDNKWFYRGGDMPSMRHLLGFKRTKK